VSSGLNRQRFEIIVSLQVLIYYLLFIFLVKNAYIGMGYWGITGFVGGLLMLKKNNRLSSVLIVFVPFWIIFITMSFFGGMLHWIGGAIAASIAGIILAIVANANGKVWLWGTVNLVLCFWIIPLLAENAGYAHAVISWNLPVPEEDEFSFKQDTVILSDFKGKVIVLDFWHTRCGSCYQKFPELERLYQKYRNNDRVSIMAINIPIREDTLGEAQARMTKLGYTFDNLYALANSTAAKMSVTTYPTVIYIDKYNKIRYSGQLNLNARIINNTETLIERLLKETVPN